MTSAAPTKFIIEGLDRLGKDTLIAGITNRLGYYQIIHFSKPRILDAYARTPTSSPLLSYQKESFRNIFKVLQESKSANIILNRAHLGEYVYGPLYRSYSGSYIFELEEEFELDRLRSIRLILLTENFSRSQHVVDDKQSLGTSADRPKEQALFEEAFARSRITDKRIICVTSPSGAFRHHEEILDEALCAAVAQTD